MPSDTQSTTPTEFVEQAFETAVSETEEDHLIEVLDKTVSNLREQIDDDTLEEILRKGPGRYVLKSSMTRDGLQPEPFTQQALIEPLLTALGHEFDTEAGGLSGGRTMVADYTVSLRDHPEIDSTRLLLEAEPINKDLDSRKHGIGQVRDWLSQREFESDFGFATDGLRWAFVRYDPDSYTHNVIEEVDLQPVFLALFENQVGARDPPQEAVFDADRERVTRLLRTFDFDNFVSIAGDARQVIKRKQKEITDEFYEDYIRYVFGIVTEGERTTRSLVGDGVVKPEGATEEDARLFAVELMNRLIFIKFLEDKRIVQPDMLATIKETYQNGTYMGSLYDEFLQRLFYDVMNKRPKKRPKTVKNIDLFSDIPYLNSGLFRPTIGEDDNFGEKDFDVRNSVLESIIDLLEGYSFSAGGAPTDLDPSVLGNVFEKTINYITTDDGDKNKERGAYYTPSEITRFCAERTVRPALLDRFQTVLVEECDWPEHEAERFDSVYELVEGLPGHMGTIGPLLDEVDEFRVVDPACGSGHFLTSSLEEIVNIRKALYAQNESYPDEYRLKKTTVLNNIYGVDIMGPAVEIGKLRLWLSIISELEREDVDDLDDDDLALPNIVFNLRQGNSLVGYTGFPETTNNGEYRLGKFSEESVRERYEDIIEEIEKHEQAVDSETAEKHRREAFRKLQQARTDLIDDIHGQFVAAGIEDITTDRVGSLDPFNWVLEFAEVYADGGFDVVIGNPPWDQVKPRRDEFFVRYEPTFRSLSLNERDELIEDLLEDDDVQQEWDEYQRKSEIQSTFFTDSGSFELQSSVVDGRTRRTANELAALFLERVFQIARDDGYVSLVLPGLIWQGLSTKSLRMHLLDETTIDSLITFENKGIFQNIHDQYKFGVVTFLNNGRTEALRGIGKQRDTEVLQNFEEYAFEIPRSVLEQYSPEGRIFPQVQSKEEVETLDKILRYPHLDDTDQAWFGLPYMELRQSTDSDRLLEDESEAEYPVIGGSNIYQYTHDPTFYDLESPDLWSVEEETDPETSAKRRIREKKKKVVKNAVFDAFDGTGSKKGFVNGLLEDHRGKPLSIDDVLLDCTEYRMVYRRITNSTNERSLIATVIPPGVVCHDGVYTIQPYTICPDEENLNDENLRSAYERVFTDAELFVCLGFVNSLPFDFLMRTKIDTTIPVYKFEESQVPRLTEGDDWFEYIWTRAARLNCYGEKFEEMRDRLGGIEPATDMNKRRELQVEIDAAAFHAYGLDREQTDFVLSDFYKVNNPRMMDEAYFEMVLEKYDELNS
jgi:hypothetical protein